MVDIYSKIDQSVIGKVYDSDKMLLENDVKAIIRIDINDTFEAEARLLLNNNKWFKYQNIIYETNNGDQLTLIFSRGNIFKTDTEEVIYKITSGIMRGEKRKQNKYLSGAVEGLLYFSGEKVELNNMTIECKEVENRNSNYNKTKYYYEITTDDDLKYNDANLLFAMLSAISGAKFFCNIIHHKGGRIELHRRYSKKCRLVVYGSGKLLYPLKLDDLLTLKEKIDNDDFLFNILINYTDFTTDERSKHQLVLGCNILDYIIELYEHSIGKYEPGKTKKLYSILRSFYSTDTDVFKYLKSLIIQFPEAYSELNKKFEFYELRDQIVHRGKVLTDKNELRVFLDNIFVLNEIIRILLPHLYKFSPVYMKQKDIYKMNKMENSIEMRRRVIDKKC